jgi:hypothetical protein
MLVAAGVSAQTADEAWAPAQLAVACAMPASVDMPAADVLRVMGGQDSVPRSIFGVRDLIVIGGGLSRQVELGQRFFVRRTEWLGLHSPTEPHAIRTAGWVKVVAVNDTTAIATVEHVCSNISEGDYLEPFTRPSVAATNPTVDTTGELDFNALGHVMHGELLRSTGGPGDFMLIDRGSDQGTAPGSRFAVYRDLKHDGLPLTAIGEVVVVSASPSIALVRITQSRDAVASGDFVVPRK